MKIVVSSSKMKQHCSQVKSAFFFIKKVSYFLQQAKTLQNDAHVLRAVALFRVLGFL